LPSHNDAAPAGIDLGASGKLAVEGGVDVRRYGAHSRDAIGEPIANALWWSALEIAVPTTGVTLPSDPDPAFAGVALTAVGKLAVEACI
jgi:hypothetical protein